MPRHKLTKNLLSALVSTLLLLRNFATQEKHGSWYVEIETNGVKRWALLNQVRILDKKRLTNKISEIDKVDFQKVKDRFLEFYGS